MSIGPRTRRALVTTAVAGGVVGLHAGAIAFFANRNPYAETIFPPCVLLHFTGIQCPGCGGTRAMYSLLHGDVLGSLQMNPIVIAGYLAVLLGVTGMTIGGAKRPRLAKALYASAAVVSLAALAWSMVIRNLL